MRIKILFLLLFSFQASMDAQCFDCAKNIGNHVDDHIEDIDQTNDGIILTILQYNFTKGALYKYDFNCNLLWIHELPYNITTYNTTVDDLGNIYTIGGNEQAENPYEGKIIPRGVFLMKFDPGGKLLWVRPIGGQYVGVKIHYWNNSVYIVGQAVYLNLDGESVTSNGKEDLYIARLDLNGELMDLEIFGEASSDYIYSSTMDDKGNIFILGYSTSQGSAYNHLTKYNADMVFQWQQRISVNTPGQWLFIPTNIYYNPDNKKVYVWGSYQGPVNIYNNSVTNNSTYAESALLEISSLSGGLERYFTLETASQLPVPHIANGRTDNIRNGFMAHNGNDLYILTSFRGTLEFDNGNVTSSFSGNAYHEELVLLKVSLQDFSRSLLYKSFGPQYDDPYRMYLDGPGPILFVEDELFLTAFFQSSPMTLNGQDIQNNSGNDNTDVLFYKHIINDTGGGDFTVIQTCEGEKTVFELRDNYDKVNWNFGDPASGAENFSANENPEHIFTSAGSFKVSVEIHCGDEKQIIEKEVLVSKVPKANKPSNLYACEEFYGSATASGFNTSTIETWVLGGQTGMKLTYFDPLGNEMDWPLPNPMTNSLPGRQTIKLRVANENNPGCYAETSFDLIVQSLPAIQEVPDFYSCDTDTDGIAETDLRAISARLTGTSSNLSLSYFNENGAPVVLTDQGSYTNSKPFRETLTARLTLDATGCYSEIEFDLVINPLAIAHPLQERIGCDDDNDGISEYFDLSGLEAEVLQGQTGMQVSYFRNDGSEITGMTSPYTNLQSYEETLQVRVGNPQTGCYAETSLTLKTSAAPALNTPETMYSCDAGFGIGSFDTSDWNQNIIGNQTGLKVTYYNQSGNSLPNPLPALFSNAVANTEKITARVENELNSLCVSETSFDLIINKKQELNIQETYNLCDLEPFLDLNPGGNFDTWEWQDVGGTVISNTSEASLTAAGNYSVWVSKTENGVTCENSYAFRLIRSQLPAITEVKYQEWSSSNYIEIMAGGDGDLEYSIDGVNFQDSNYFGNIPGGNYTVFARDRMGCGMASAEVVLIDYPKYFTPNNDGYHDHWQIKGVATQAETRVLIFDRYGKLLKQISSQSLGWDGNFNGKMMPADDYWFSIALEDGKIFKGHFSLIR